MNCKNCKNELISSKYCNNCGAKVITERLTFKRFFKELNEQVFEFENNKVFKTFYHLLLKPEIVIGSYIKGVRKKYMNPFSFLLFTLTLSGLAIYFTRDLAIANVAEMVNKNQEASIKSFMNLIYDYNSIFISLLIPFYALTSYIVFFNKKIYNYIEHTILYIYSQAMYSLLGVFTTLIYYALSLKMSISFSFLISGIWVIYNTIILKRIFKLSIKQTIIKVLYFVFLALIIYLFFILLYFLISYLLIGSEFFDQFKPQ